MTPATHPAISPALVGTPVVLDPGHAVARLATLPEMAADERGLVHGGFVFGLADYAAMLAVNDPFVVLAAAEVRFLAPVVAGEVVEAEARVEHEEGRKRRVLAWAWVGERRVLEGSFECAVLGRHVLDRRAGPGG